MGTFRRGLEVSFRNVTGIGDSLSALYTNTDGSDMVEVSYSIPLNSIVLGIKVRTLTMIDKTSKIYRRPHASTIRL
ncbi:MAG: hypothetical protein O4965_08400 [Trichodesmium sp. St19_bin1]|nr:hypothetical protein [Trichodesmium sp. St19_bin1]